MEDQADEDEYDEDVSDDPAKIRRIPILIVIALVNGYLRLHSAPYIGDQHLSVDRGRGRQGYGTLGTHHMHLQDRSSAFHDRSIRLDQVVKAPLKAIPKNSPQ